MVRTPYMNSATGPDVGPNVEVVLMVNTGPYM